MSSKADRKYEKLQIRVANLERVNGRFDERVSKLEEHNIVDDLTRETYPGSGRWFFTYQNIAERNGVSASTVSRVAEKNCISRREVRPV